MSKNYITTDNPYQRTRREKSVADIALAKAHALEEERERLVKEGKLRKIVTYDPVQRLTCIHYEKINKQKASL